MQDSNLLQERMLREEDNLLVELINEEAGDDILIRFEQALFLLDKTELGGLYLNLLTLIRIGYLKHQKQNEIAKRIGLSNDTYYKRRDELARLGLIKLEKRGKKRIILIRKFNRLSEFKLPSNLQKHDTYLNEQINLIKPLTENDVKLEEQQLEQLRINGIAEEKATEIIKRKEEIKKKEEQRFPADDYRIVLNAYSKYKGVGLIGPEVLRAKHAIKQIFLAQRSTNQIIDCLKFFHDHANNENYRWLHSWTLETVMKKMPEFVSGKLRLPEIGDDIPRS